MKLWLDAQLSPSLARWLASELGVDATAVADVGLRDASDAVIFAAARAADVVVMTKDSDFVALLDRLGPPPRIVWLTCGNTSNARMREVLRSRWQDARALLDAGEELVEIADRR